MNDTIEVPVTQTATDSNVLCKTIRLSLPIKGPVAVRDASGRTIGSAEMAFVDHGIMAEISLDKNTPEAFEMDVNPDMLRATVKFSGQDDDIRIEFILGV